MSLEKEYYRDKRKHSDPYCYEGTNILINNLGIQDSKALESYERAYVSQRLLKVYTSKHNGDFSLKHYMNLHKYLFDGVYPFAGKIRNVDIAKGNTYFARHQFIKEEMTEILQEMKRQLPQVKDIDEYSKSLSKYYIDLNLAHPFREGNGRCQREFFREYVEYLNPKLPFPDVELDYSKMNKGLFLKGVIEFDAECLSTEFKNALIPKTKEKIAGENNELRHIK